MLDDFKMVGKKQILRNKVDWNSHFILTDKNKPIYICVNLDLLTKNKDWERIGKEVEEYYG